MDRRSFLKALLAAAAGITAPIVTLRLLQSDKVRRKPRPPSPTTLPPPSPTPSPSPSPSPLPEGGVVDILSGVLPTPVSPVTRSAPADVNTVWTPSMSGTTDYTLDHGGVTRHRKLAVGGGGRVAWCTGLHIDVTVDQGPMIEMLNGLDYLVLEGCHLTDTGEYFTDGMRGGRTGSSTTVSSSTNAWGGDAYTGVGGGTLIMFRSRIDLLVGSDGSPPPEVHADGIQYPGGIGECYWQDVTIQSAYVGVQGQREQFTTGIIASLTAATFDGVNDRMDLTFSDPLNLDPSNNQKMWVEIKDANPTTWRGTYRVLSILTGSAGAATKVRVNAPLSNPTAWTGGGTAQQSRWIYYVGSHHWNRVNILRMDNRADVVAPTETLSSFRVPGSGRPKAKGSSAEDRFEGITYGMAGQFSVHDVYVEPNPGETALDMIEPHGSGVPAALRPALVSGSPDYVHWPTQTDPKIIDVVTGLAADAKVYEGTPPGGDYAPANKVGLNYDPDDPFWPGEEAPPPVSSTFRFRRRMG